MEKFERAIRQIERILKVRILAYLVLQISSDREEVRLHILNLIRSGLLRLPQRKWRPWWRAGGAGVVGLWGVAGFMRGFTCGRLAWLAGDVANHCQHGGFTRGCVRPLTVVMFLGACANCKYQHRCGRSR
jgi:hypothetical protein